MALLQRRFALTASSGHWIFIGMSSFILTVLGCSSSNNPTMELSTITPYGQTECNLISEMLLEEISEVSLVPSRIGVLGSGAIFCEYYWVEDTLRTVGVMKTEYNSVDNAISNIERAEEIFSTDVPFATHPVISNREQRLEVVNNLGDGAFIRYETLTLRGNNLSTGILWLRSGTNIIEISYNIYLPTEQALKAKLLAIADAIH